MSLIQSRNRTYKWAEEQDPVEAEEYSQEEGSDRDRGADAVRQAEAATATK